jgi:hypothetical protein
MNIFTMGFELSILLEINAKHIERRFQVNYILNHNSWDSHN